MRIPHNPRRDDMPDLPTMTMMAQAAASLHEAYTAYVEAGFAPHQALYLVGLFVTPQHQQPQPPPGPQP